MFPESFTFSIADWVNGWVDALVTHYGDVFRHISDTLLWAFEVDAVSYTHLTLPTKA